nr:hypothetical protein [Pandoravirus aubagnensis]
MRRRRNDDALWSQGARLCAAARSGAALSLEDNALLDQIARDVASDAYVSSAPSQRPCDVLAAAGGPAWVREVDTWMNRLGWSPPSTSTASGALMESGPTAKRPRFDGGSASVLMEPDETARPTGPTMPTYRSVRVSARPPLAVLRAMLPNVPEALLPYVALPDAMNVVPQATVLDTTTTTRRPPLFGVRRVTRPTALPDDMDIPIPSGSPVESDSAPYQERVPFDVQDLIMRRLIETDPQSALALAGTSTRQASLLADRIERARQRAAAQSLADFGQPAGATGEYMRARTAFGGDPRDAPLAIALCLMEAFARFLLDYDRGALSTGREARQRRTNVGTRHGAAQGGEAPPHMGDYDFVYDSRLVDQVAADPRLGNLRDRVRAWYQWIETPGRERSWGQPEAHRGPIQTLMEGYAGPANDTSALLAAPLVYLPYGVEISATWSWSAGGWAQPLARFRAPDQRQPQQVSDLVEGAPYDNAVHRPRAWEWARDSIGMYPDEFINRGVRQHLRGSCALIARETPLAMPDFTSVFNMQFVLRPTVARDTLYAKNALACHQASLGLMSRTMRTSRLA